MTHTTIFSAVHDGLASTLVAVESNFTRGFSGVHLIGNASDICRDGKERAKAALESLGLPLPNKRLVISLTPADVKKDGNHLDLPMAVSLGLLLLEREPAIRAQRWLFAGELGLTGEIKAIRGVVSFAMQAASAGLDGIVISTANLREMWALTQFDLIQQGTLRIMAFNHLQEVMTWLASGDDTMAQGLPAQLPDESNHKCTLDFDDMVLSPALRRLAMTAAAGGHSLLLRGTPGTGKSMFAARLPSIMPAMGQEEHLEALRIQSAYSETIATSLIKGVPPFRAPHHHASAAALLGNADTPGELSLAHGGILFLDEFPEFRRDLLEALREPLENGMIHVARSKKKVAWCSRLLLIAATNDCPCGWYGSSRRLCTCAPVSIQNYRNRLSGPILDRIDLHYTMPEFTNSSASLLSLATNAASTPGTATAAMRDGVIQARRFAAERNQQWGLRLNRDLRQEHLAQASGHDVTTFSSMLDKHGRHFLSQRALARSLKVARTLADLEQREHITEADLEQTRLWQDNVVS